MTVPRLMAAATLGGALLVGTLADAMTAASPNDGEILAGDLHVHGFPIDGTLPRWELQREALRRGLDVIAIANHNKTFAGRFVTFLNGAGVIALPGQELTTPGFHIVAAGISDTIDWRLPARAAIAEIHRQGGVAIAAHPVNDSWLSRDEEAIRQLDGVEALHPLVHFEEARRPELEAFYTRVRAVNPDVAPIGSSDFHFFPDMGFYRTYLFVTERSERGVLEAIRQGRTVASDNRGALSGNPELVQAVRQYLSERPVASHRTRQLRRLAGLAALLACAGMVVFK